MSKGIKITASLLTAYATLAFLHIWLNVGFDKLGLGASDQMEAPRRVGFLPVT